jgi:hypothetical protein
MVCASLLCSGKLAKCWHIGPEARIPECATFCGRHGHRMTRFYSGAGEFYSKREAKATTPILGSRNTAFMRQDARQVLAANVVHAPCNCGNPSRTSFCGRESAFHENLFSSCLARLSGLVARLLSLGRNMQKLTQNVS